MATKAKEIDNYQDGTGCLGKAADDEPLFILRAQDATAPDLVRRWARQVMASSRGILTPKVKEALEIADAMVAWQARTGRCKIPD